jgi:hypothetical protein
MKTNILIFTLFAVFCFFSSADEKPKKPAYYDTDVRILRNARTEYGSGNYGQAIKLAEEAKIARKDKISWEIYTLQGSLKSSEVRKANDELSEIVPILEKRQEYDSIEIIKRYEEKIQASSINNSASRLVAYISGREMYPEADWLIGNIYKFEGEYNLAEKYLLSAWNHASLLDVPDEQYDILYSLADIAYDTEDFDNYEADLLLIVGDNKYFTNPDINDVVMLAIRNRKSGEMEKFFNMFRSDEYRSLKAYSKLSDYYEEKGDRDKALKACSLGVLTGFTKMYNTVKQRDPEFEYVKLYSLFIEIEKYPDIVEWSVENKIWKCFTNLADKTFNDGDIQFAEDLYTVLSNYAPEQYWKEQAAGALKKITQ